MAIIVMLSVQVMLFIVVAGRMTDPAARRFAPILIAAGVGTMMPPLAVIAAVLGWSALLRAVLPLFYVGPLLALALTAMSPPGAIVQDVRRLWRVCREAVR